MKCATPNRKCAMTYQPQDPTQAKPGHHLHVFVEIDQ